MPLPYSSHKDVSLKTILATCLLSTALVSSAEIIPIEKVNVLPIAGQDGVVIKENLFSAVNFTASKYHSTLYNYQENTGAPYPGVKAISPKSRRSNQKRASVEPLIPGSGISYWRGSITIGGQPFNIDFDTGSADLWVPSIDCTQSTCAKNNKYDVTKSSTGKYIGSTYSTSYGDESGVSGKVYADTVRVAGVDSKNQYFAAVTQKVTTLDSEPVDGILGLSYAVISDLKHAPVFQNTWANNKAALVNNYFSFYLTSNPTGSHLYWGGSDASKYNAPLYSYPVTRQAYWQIGQARAVVNGKTAVSGRQAIIDTGTSLVYGPPAIISQIFASIPGSKPWTNGFYTFPCSSTPTVGLAFSSASGAPVFNFAQENFNLGRTSSFSSDCVASVVGKAIAGDAFLVGDAWLKNVYTVFDFSSNSVKFATLK